MNLNPLVQPDPISREEFQAILDATDYYRIGWADCIEYRQKHSHTTVGYESNDGRFWLPPEVISWTRLRPFRNRPSADQVKTGGTVWKLGEVW